MNVIAALSAVMRDVQAVGKQDRNQQQGFAFRGIDSVINAVGPALREHGVVILPCAQSVTSEQYTTARDTTMRNVVVKIDWHIYGPEGDSITAVTYGEAADAGDKAVSKAHSVAYRTCLLQTLCIPTDEPDPDASTHERSAHRPEPPESSRVRAWQRAQAAGKQRRPDLDSQALTEWLVAQAAEHKLDGRQTDDLDRLSDILEADQQPEGAPF